MEALAKTDDKPKKDTPKRHSRSLPSAASASAVKPLTELVARTSRLIREISDHPEYIALMDKGYFPELTLADAQIALVHLQEELVKELKLRLSEKVDVLEGDEKR